VGEEIGILSYNESPYKEVLLDGIAVISTDFVQLGRTAANLVLSGEKMHISNPFSLILRNSI
jgi:DNA-binding LacI/PurR family transcriptional regulator